MEVTKQLERLTGEIRDLLRKLTTSQKITLLLLGVLVAGAVVLAVTLSRGESYVKLGTRVDSKSLTALKGLLDQNGVPNRLVSEGASGALEVPRDRAAHASWLAVESGIATPRDQNLEWLFGEGSFLDTPSRMDQRLLESRKRTVEDAIRWSRSIRDARIVVQRGPEPIYAERNGASDSAAVAVALRPGVEALSRSEAGAIRTLVSGAFRILPQNIQLTDDRLVPYPYVEAALPGSEDEDRTRKVVLATVEGLLGRVYRPAEFVVGVLADVSPRRSQIRTMTFDPEKVVTAERSSVKETETNRRPAGSPVGVDPNVGVNGSLGAPGAALPAETQTRERKEATFENQFTRKEESVEVPPGEVQGLAVNVVLDRAAVRRVLQAEESSRLTAERRTAEKVENDSQIVNFTVEGKVGANNLDQAIEVHRRFQTGFLVGQLPQSGARVNVSVIPFPRPELPVEVAASRRAMGWASDHWGDLLLGSIVILGLFLLYRMFQRSLPQPLDVPPLDETALQQEAYAADEEVRKLEEALASTARKVAGATVELDSQGVDKRIVESVKNANALTRENPELASAVIRMWMAEKSAQE